MNNVECPGREVNALVRLTLGLVVQPRGSYDSRMATRGL